MIKATKTHIKPRIKTVKFNIKLRIGTIKNHTKSRINCCIYSNYCHRFRKDIKKYETIHDIFPLKRANRNSVLGPSSCLRFNYLFMRASYPSFTTRRRGRGMLMMRISFSFTLHLYNESQAINPHYKPLKDFN